MEDFHAYQSIYHWDITASYIGISKDRVSHKGSSLNRWCCFDFQIFFCFGRQQQIKDQKELMVTEKGKLSQMSLTSREGSDLSEC